MISNNNNWNWVELGEACDRVETVKRKERVPKQKLLYIDIGGINNQTHKIIGHKEYIWENAPSRAQQIIQKDDILFSTVRTYLKNIAMVDSENYDGEIASSGFTVIRAKKSIALPKYLFYLSISNIILEPLNKLQTGSSYPAVRDKDVFSRIIPLPTLEEQKKIVSKIEELFSELDKSVEELKTAQQQLKVYRQAVLKWAFEGRLTNGNIQDVELPAGWKVFKLKDITQEKNGLRRGPFGSAIKKSFFVENGYKVYEQGNAINDDPYRGTYYVDENKYKELENFKVLPQDLIVSCSGVTLGRISEIPADAKQGIINQALLRIRLRHDKVRNRFFILLFRAAFFQRKIFDQSQGTAMPNLVGIKDFKEIELIVPSLDEQQRVVQEIEARFSVCDKSEETIANSLEQAEALRQSILKRAFEGKLSN